MDGNDIYDGDEEDDGNFGSGGISIGEGLKDAFVTEKMVSFLMKVARL